MSKLRKFFTVSVMLMTVLSLSVVVAPSAGATASAGDLIKMDGLSSVYYLAADGKRYVFPNESTYFSWYSDWSGIVTVSQSELEGYPLGANVTVRPGTKLVKITTNPTVYAVEPNGTLRSIVSEANAIALWGADWAKRVIDVPDSFFTNYTTGTALTAGQYPVGTLVKTSGSADVHYISADGKARKFANEASFVANRLSWDDVVTAGASYTLPTAGTEVSAAESDITDTSSGAGGTVGAGTGLTVALSSTNPAAGSILSDGATTGLDGQALIPALKINFTAASDGAVKITTLKLNRTGISADSDIDNAYLYDGDSITARLADMQSISSKVLTFTDASGLFTVPAGTTKTVTVRFDLNRESTSGKTIGFDLVAASDITTNGASVSGSFPFAGNLMSTADVDDFGSVQVTRVTDNTTSVDPGTKDFTAGHWTITPGNQDMEIRYLKLKMIGSAATADIKNVRLYDSATMLGSAQELDSNNNVAFDLSASPLVMTSSQAKNLYIKVDVENGATRTFYFSIQKGADIIVYEKEYGIYLRPKSSATVGTFTSQDSSTVTIGSGSLTVSKTTDSPTGNIADGATNVTFVKYSMKATGEDIKVSSISYYCTASNTADTAVNVKVVVDGTQLGTTDAAITCNGTAPTENSATTTVNFTVKAGETKYLTLVGDTTGTMTANDTVYFTLGVGSANGQRQSALTTLAVPSAAVNGNTLTVKTGTVSAIEDTSGMGDYDAANPTGVVGTKDVKIGSFMIKAGAGEDVDITKINIRDNGTEDLGGDFQNLRLVAGNTMTDSAGNTTITVGGAIGSTIGTLQTSVSYDYEFSPVTAVRIRNGADLRVDVYADILTNAADTASAFAGVILYSVTATGVSTSASAGATTSVTGQNVYIAASGTLTIENVPSSDQAQANIVYSSDTGANEVELYKFKLTALTEATDVTRFIITDTIASGAYSATDANAKPTSSIYNFKIYDNDGLLIAGPVSLTPTGTPTNGGYIDFNLGTGNEYAINAGAEKIITLKGTVNTASYISSGATHTFTLDTDPIEDDSTNAVVARGHDSSVDKSGPSSGLSGNAITIRRAYPVVTREAVLDSNGVQKKLESGSTTGATLAKFKVTAAGGQVRLKKMTFNVTLSDTTTSTALSLGNFRLFRNGVQIGNTEYDIYDGTGSAAADELSPGGTATLSTLQLNNSLGAQDGQTETTTSTRMVLVFSTTAELAGGQNGEGEEIIGAGNTNSYEIKADITNAHQGTPATDSDSIVIQLLGDDGQTEPLTGTLTILTTEEDLSSTYRRGLVSIAAATNYNFIWSDYSANTGDHTDEISGGGLSSDWTHGYQVRSTTATPASYIPLDSWTLSR